MIVNDLLPYESLAAILDGHSAMIQCPLLSSAPNENHQAAILGDEFVLNLSKSLLPQRSEGLPNFCNLFLTPGSTLSGPGDRRAVLPSVKLC